MMTAREGELTYYDNDGWPWPATWRTAGDWVVITRSEDGNRMAFDRTELADALGFHPADVIRRTDGTTTTPG